MTTTAEYPWMKNIKPRPTAEQAALIDDLGRVAAAAQAALQTYVSSGSGKYESEPWRATYDAISNAASAAYLKWSTETAKYLM